MEFYTSKVLIAQGDRLFKSKKKKLKATLKTSLKCILINSIATLVSYLPITGSHNYRLLSSFILCIHACARNRCSFVVFTVLYTFLCE